MNKKTEISQSLHKTHPNSNDLNGDNPQIPRSRSHQNTSVPYGVLHSVNRDLKGLTVLTANCESY